MSIFNSSNKGKIWGPAAIAGVLAFLALKIIAAYTFGPALLLAILIAILVAVLLWIGFYRDADEDSGLISGTKMATGAAAATTVKAAASAAPAKAESAPAGTKPAAAVKPKAAAASKVVAKPAASKAKAAAKPAAAKAKVATKPKTAAKPKVAAKSTSTAATTRTKAAAPKAAPKTAPKTAAAKNTAASLMGVAGAAMVNEKKAEKAKATTKPKAAAKPKTTAKPAAKDGKPTLLSNARAGGADNLKTIKGVGPGLEKTLNELGFYHFDQVASWGKKEITWVDDRLKFKGRIERDEWVKQAKVLAKGGVT